MKTTLKPRSRPSPDEALAIAAQTTPTLPPAQVQDTDRPATLNMRLRGTTIAAITKAAHDRRLTIKQVVCLALADAGIEVAPADLEDRTPRRR
jgi:hypothetical protein